MNVFWVFQTDLVIHFYFLEIIPAWFSRDFNAALVWLQLASTSGFRAIRIPLYPGGKSVINSPNAARSKRLARFLCTALPMDLPAVTANREFESFTVSNIKTRSGWA